MPIAVIVSFMVVFALVLLAVSVGLKFFDARRKSQVAEMLHTASGEPVIVVTNLLKDIDFNKPTGFKRVLASFQFSTHAQQQIQQAGLSWSSARLIAAMGVAMIPGLGLGAWWKILLNGPTSAVVFALITGSIPYLIVRHKRKKRLDTLEAQFPDALDFLARSMRAGHAFSISLEMPLRPAFSGAIHAGRPRIFDQPGNAGRRGGGSSGARVPGAVQRAKPGGSAGNGVAEFFGASAFAGRAVLHFVGARS